MIVLKIHIFNTLVLENNKNITNDDIKHMTNMMNLYIRSSKITNKYIKNMILHTLVIHTSKIISDSIKHMTLNVLHFNHNIDITLYSIISVHDNIIIIKQNNTNTVNHYITTKLSYSYNYSDLHLNIIFLYYILELAMGKIENNNKFNKLNKINNIGLNMEYTKPFIKWVGGKSQIIDKVLETFPKTINNYHEIFLGGGSVLLAFLKNVKVNNIKLKGNVYAYDLNESLINTYLNIKNNVTSVLSELEKIKKEYENISGTEVNRKANTLEEAKTSQESYYYYMRSKYNKMTKREKNTALGSAMFIFINKTCFRGLYREGKNGINVPFGHYKNPSIYDDEHIKEISDLIKDVTFACCSFKDSLDKPQKGDFVYMDPPYAPEKETSFVGYTSDGFNLETHNLLFNKCYTLYDKKIKFVMSNADVNLVKNAFKDTKKYTITSFSCKRNINAKNPKQKTNEVLIQIK